MKLYYIYTMKTILILATAFILFSCGSTRQSFRRHSVENSCKHPIFIACVGKESEIPNELTVYTLLKDAQRSYGPEVTIQNVIWEVKSRVKVNVIYDVVRCNPEVDKPADNK